MKVTRSGAVLLGLEDIEVGVPTTETSDLAAEVVHLLFHVLLHRFTAIFLRFLHPNFFRQSLQLPPLLRQSH
jgi:hypothetical protein